MKRRHTLTRRTCLRLMLLAMLSMLGQQVALGSYLCPAADVPAGHTAMTMHCEGRSSLQKQQAPALCAQHCAQQATATADARLPTVPPLLMPALLPAPLTLITTYAPGSRVRSDAAAPVRGIAPVLRFRVLLI